MFASMVLLASGITAVTPPAPADFSAYVEEVRKAGMTESARGDLRMVAGIMLGGTVVEFPRDPASGGFGRAYRSTSCPAPGLSAQARAKLAEEAAAREAPIVERLREVADTDRSGFVSTSEGWELRRTFEFGIQLAAMAPREGGDRAKLAKLMNVTPAEFEQRLTAYGALVRAFSGLPVRYLPGIPPLASP
jgi:hypothetical protein